jgi:hypothetical protein
MTRRRSERKLAELVTVIMVAGHIAIVLGTLGLGLSGLVRFEDALDLLPLYVPVTGAYASLMWAWLLAPTRVESRSSVSHVVYWLSVSVVVALFAAEVGLVAGKVWNRISLPQCKVGLTATEVVLAAFIGPVVRRFFPSAEPPKSKPEIPEAPAAPMLSV